MARNPANETFALSSFLYGGNADYIETLHAAGQKDAQSVSPEWQAFFAEFKSRLSVRRKDTVS